MSGDAFLHDLSREEGAEGSHGLSRRLDDFLCGEMVGRGGGLSQVMNRVRMSAPVDVPVLITGETGAGKEVVAKAIHGMSSRQGKPFVVVNCGAIPPNLMDSELFGHSRGAFTGASSAHKGRFERADGGTLFLDEVGELPLEVQTRLLRVLETREVEKVGGKLPFKVDIRVIAATHRHLGQMVSDGLFREDLYYRLRVVSIHVPPLRERRQDIPELVRFLLLRLAARYGVGPFEVEKAEMDALLRYAWPGNVRQLQNVLEEAVVCSGGKALHVALPGEVSGWGAGEGNGADAPLPDMDTAMREYLQRCLYAARGKIEGLQGAARIAGVTPSTFRFRCKKLRVERQ